MVRGVNIKKSSSWESTQCMCKALIDEDCRALKQLMTPVMVCHAFHKAVLLIIVFPLLS